jgi:hypothetical protein
VGRIAKVPRLLPAPSTGRTCPECRVPESVLENICEVCFAEFDELPPAASARAS